MKWWVAAMVLFSISAKASELNPVCHQLYEMFQMPDLTYEDVGKIADHMHKNNCWPALQETASDNASAPPLITDCASLRAAVWDLGATGDKDSSWHWIKLYDAKPISIVNNGEAIGGILRQRSIARKNPGFPRSKYDALLDTVLVEGSTRVLECEAQVNTIGHGAIWLYLYLDRDSDGEELYGYVYLGLLHAGDEYSDEDTKLKA